MDAAYCLNADMDYGRMFDSYMHKGGDSFDLSLSVPESNPHHLYMADQPPYSGYDTPSSAGETYADLGRMPGHVSSQDQENPAPHGIPPHTTQQHQPMYHMGLGGLDSTSPFPPQSMYLPPISQHGAVMAAHTTGYLCPTMGPGGSPLYTSAGVGPPPPLSTHPMMRTPGPGMPPSSGHYYHRPPVVRSGESPASGGSPSPGSEDSDDAAAVQVGRGKRPTQDSEIGAQVPVAGAGRGKKARVSKKSKKKKDPNEPQKPVSAYAHFFRDTQAAIKGQNPSASFGEVSKIVASMWDSLDAENKSVYKKKAESDKKEYLKALAAYRASLVSKSAEGEQSMYSQNAQSYPQYQASPAYGFPTTSSGGSLPPQLQGPSPGQLSPMAKKSPLLTSLMSTEGPQPPMMNPPMSQPMPASAPSVMPHGNIPQVPLGGQAQPALPTHNPHQSSVHSPHLNQMNAVPPSPYITQTNPALSSPGSSMSSDVGSPVSHSMHQAQQQQQQSAQQSQQQQGSGQQNSPQHQSVSPLAPSQQQGGQCPHGTSGQPMNSHPNMVSCNGGACIRSGCTNPAVHNPEWEDEYCSNECVVSHCRDVFNAWVASNASNAPTYPAPVK